MVQGEPAKEEAANMINTAEPGTVLDCLQFRSSLAPLPAAGEFGRCAACAQCVGESKSTEMIRNLIQLLFSGQGQLAPASDRQAKWPSATAVETKVREIVAEVTETPIDQVSPESNIYRIGSSSDDLEVIMRCEEDFGIEIPDGEAEQCESIGKLAAYIKKQLGVTPIYRCLEKVLEFRCQKPLSSKGFWGADSKTLSQCL